MQPNARLLKKIIPTLSILICANLLAAEPPRDVNTHHLFTPPGSKSAWEKRAAELRQQTLFSAGLYPMPEKSPLNPHITGTFEGPDFFVDNVAIETWPGFFLCGNLYRPKNKKGPFPGIVNPHGHWAAGRLHIEPDEPLAKPPPAPPALGKANLVAIGINLARQGSICFSYDMCGYNDTNQIPAHRNFANGLQPWLWNVSLNGLQLWNSIRVVDFLESLPDVDRKRIGVTGASGGGTQTFELCTVDERIACAVPVNMVSAHMQGGCLCENGPGLRLGTDNPEVAAVFAPRPLLLVAATGDWTKNVPVEEWPAIKTVYDLFNAGDKTACVQFNYKHNYNIESREAMYAWFGRWFFKDTDPEHFREKPIDLDPKILHCWSEKMPRPADALSEAQLVQSLITYPEKRLAEIWPSDKKSLKHFQETLRPALQSALGPRNFDVSVTYPASERILVVVATKASDMPTEIGNPGDSVWPLLLKETPESAESLWKDFFITYNQTLAGTHANTVAATLAYIKKTTKAKRIDVVGVGRAGLWALLGRALEPVNGSVAIDTAGFNNTDDKTFIEKLYSPGLRRAGDVRTAAMLIAPQPLCLFNTGGVFKADEVAKAYRDLKATLRVEQGPLSPSDVTAWLGSN